MKSFFAFLCLLLISGCTYSELGRTSNFDNTSTQGLALIGVSGKRDFSAWFAKFDPSTHRLLAVAFSGHEGIAHNGGEKITYKLLSMSPGIYVVKNLQYRRYPTTHIYCLNKGTYQFEIKSGQIFYLGAITLGSGSRIFATKGSISEASKIMKEYPDVKGDISTAELTPTYFNNGTDIFGREVCGGYYFD